MLKKLFVFLFFISGVMISGVYAEPLRFGVLPVIDTLPLQVAVKEGFFNREQLEVELVPFTSANERNTAVYSGQLDGFFGDLIATLLIIDKKLARDNEVPVKILTISYYTDPDQRMFALVTSPQLVPGSKTELTVAVSKASIIEYLLTWFQKLPTSGQYSFQAVEIKQMPIRLQMLLAGKIDSALLPEPLVSLAESKGARVLDTDQALNMPLTILNISTNRLNQKDAFLRAYGKAVLELNKNPEKYRDLMAETCRIPKPLVKSFPMYKYPAPRVPSESEVKPVQDWMVEKDLLSSAISYKLLVP
ncbi:ABC transporter substrate-binding protein [bacterium]|nr:ABC transporter substrate-binding protein [bacterium]